MTAYSDYQLGRALHQHKDGVHRIRVRDAASLLGGDGVYAAIHSLFGAGGTCSLYFADGSMWLTLADVEDICDEARKRAPSHIRRDALDAGVAKVRNLFERVVPKEEPPQSTPAPAVSVRDAMVDAIVARSSAPIKASAVPSALPAPMTMAVSRPIGISRAQLGEAARAALLAHYGFAGART